MPPLGGTQTRANALNDFGYVTGWSARSGKNAVADGFLWHETLGMRDLNALKSPADTSGLEITSASAINNAGPILTRATNKTLGSVAVLLTPQLMSDGQRRTLLLG